MPALTALNGLFNAKTVQKDELIRYMARNTNLSEGQVDLAIKELRDAIIFFLSAGRPVKVEGLGSYFPNVGLDGRFDAQYRQDKGITNGLNAPGVFSGEIVNRDNIGKTSADLPAQWNAAHPDDKVA